MRRATTHNKKSEVREPHLCKDCEHHYGDFEISFATHKPFMCRCPFEEWGVFLDHECVNGKFKAIKK